MDKREIAKVFAERPLSFLFAMTIMAAFILGLIFFVYYALTNHRRDRKDFQMGVACTDWSYESPVEKHIDGPDVQQNCERYFAARSADDAQRDDVAWEQKIDAANVKWEGRQQ